MFKRLWAKLRNLQIISNRKYHFVMREVYVAGITEGARLTKIMMEAEAHDNKGCLLGPKDAEAAVAEAERIIRGGRR
ncbi:hypothetical protein LCGC14_0510240 [marine sediment metagenome]|uniref:Uncharacterized protein n=1 Tax=marine sediment metagenome TaxID=412755 RepID=A0A0F9V9U0_9ZZZZ